MRIDKFINAVNITKRRAIAQDMLTSGVVFLNGQSIKPSKEVKAGDIIEIRYLNETKRYLVLNIPQTKTIPKSQKELYVKELG